MRLLPALFLASAAAFAQAPAPAAAPAKPARVVPPARIVDFKADKTSVAAGQQVMLIWATENPNAVNITPQPGRVPPRGSTPVTPTATTTYTLTVTGPNNQMETRTLTVNVTGAAPVQTSAAPAVKHPDLSGVYNFGGGGAPGGRGAGAPAGPELKPGKESYRVTRGPEDPGALSDCMPIAGPAAYTVPYQFQIIQNDNYVVIFHEYPGTFRIIPINGVHPVDPDPTWLGDSVGKWDGDTFVVDAIGFNDRTELSGFRHSEALHIVERFKKNGDALDYEATLEDPEVFVRPWKVTRSFPLRPDLKRIDEFVCENNRDYRELFKK